MTDAQYEFHKMPRSKVLMVTFGSFTNPGRSGPSYAFMQTCLRVQSTGMVAFDVVYMKACKNDWYLSGVAGLGADRAASVIALKDLTLPYDRVICIGNSMGGYAALMFGAMISADAVLAFSPQTRFDAAFRTAINDRRWSESITKMQDAYDIESCSISSIWSKLASPRSADIVVGGMDPRDMAYAEDVSGFGFVRCHVIPNSGHDLVHDLRESGKLEKMIVDKIT